MPRVGWRAVSDAMPDFYQLVYSVIIYPIIYILPAYVANGAPVLFGGGMPIDFNRRLRGKAIFGTHKTIGGLATGLAAGFFIALAESFFLPQMLLIGTLSTLGAHFGDLLGSFMKRRIGIEEGIGLPVFDQYLFLLFAFLFAMPLGGLPGAYGIVFIIILTGILHKATNAAAFFMKIKEVPW